MNVQKDCQLIKPFNRIVNGIVNRIVLVNSVMQIFANIFISQMIEFLKINYY